jgi:lysine 6-dehydrogenase
VKILVFGAGMMGRAAVHDLAMIPGVEEVTVADSDFVRARGLADLAGPKVRAESVDVRDEPRVMELMSGCDSALSCVDYVHNFLLSRLSIEAGVSLCDLGGSVKTVERQFGLHDRASGNGVTVIPDCGLAPGIPSILVSLAARRMEVMEEVRIRVGGIPQNPLPPLNYSVVFSPRGLINEYIEKALILHDWTVEEVESLTGLEKISFPDSLGELEAFYTSGGASTLPQTMKGRVQELDYKSVRYPGHCELVRATVQLGLISSEPLMVGEFPIRPVDLFSELLSRNLPPDERDVVVLRVTVSGKTEGRPCELVYELVDYYDESTSLTATMRTTGFSASIIAQMLAKREIETTGVVPQELAVDPERFVEELRKREIRISETKVI